MWGEAGPSTWRRLGSLWEWLGRQLGAFGAIADLVALVLVATTSGLALARSADFPEVSAWSRGHPLPAIQIAAVVLLVLVQAGTVARVRRSQRNRELEDACREVAAYVDEQCPALPLRDVGIHIWNVAGPPFASHLRRTGTFLLVGNRARSGVRWTPGKGVVGLAWQRRAMVIRNLEEIRSVAGTEEAFSALPSDDRLGLSWEEFVRTRRYRAVCANPLYSRRDTGATPALCGVLTIDVLRSGHFDELRSAIEGTRFDSIVGLCETAIEI